MLNILLTDSLSAQLVSTEDLLFGQDNTSNINAHQEILNSVNAIIELDEGITLSEVSIVLLMT